MLSIFLTIEEPGPLRNSLGPIHSPWFALGLILLFLLIVGSQSQSPRTRLWIAGILLLFLVILRFL
jgi:hypothetical protein